MVGNRCWAECGKGEEDFHVWERGGGEARGRGSKVKEGEKRERGARHFSFRHIDDEDNNKQIRRLIIVIFPIIRFIQFSLAISLISLTIIITNS